MISVLPCILPAKVRFFFLGGGGGGGATVEFGVGPLGLRCFVSAAARGGGGGAGAGERGVNSVTCIRTYTEYYYVRS